MATTTNAGFDEAATNFTADALLAQHKRVADRLVASRKRFDAIVNVWRRCPHLELISAVADAAAATNGDLAAAFDATRTACAAYNAAARRALGMDAIIPCEGDHSTTATTITCQWIVELCGGAQTFGFCKKSIKKEKSQKKWKIPKQIKNT